MDEPQHSHIHTFMYDTLVLTQHKRNQHTATALFRPTLTRTPSSASLSTRCAAVMKWNASCASLKARSRRPSSKSTVQKPRRPSLPQTRKAWSRWRLSLRRLSARLVCVPPRKPFSCSVLAPLSACICLHASACVFLSPPKKKKFPHAFLLCRLVDEGN